MHFASAFALAFVLGAFARPSPQWPPSWPVWSFAPEPSPSGPVPPYLPSGGATPSQSTTSGTGTGLPYTTSASSASKAQSSVPASARSGAASSRVVLSSVASSPSGTADASTPAYIALGSSVPSGITTSISAPSGSLTSGGDLPASSGSSAISAVHTIAAGDSFDCGMIMYDRGVSCTGQDEGGDSDAVFMLENGASLSNCIIGPNQIEGVHCEGSCSLTNVWWSAVCEDAFTIKEQDAGETTTITGGGAFGAEDKVLQHNGGGTLSVSGFTVESFGKVYRSCGNCDEMYERHVTMDDITATSGSEIAGINSNYGDTATLSNIKVSDVDNVCVTYTGNDTGDEPEENGSGPSDFCIYSDSDVMQI